ncbi:MAG: type II toxin-antitoxin system HipA family toxin YjjJ [Desulfobacter sp.]|nr:MAG: type II toxin-antitoxin system HipA family toxin YjjJ [Desulfobacter sp.]
MLSIIEYLERGPSTSKEIQAATGLSQSTVSRMLKKTADRIVQIQDGRSVRYAATCNAFGGNDKLPLNMIDHFGTKSLIAYLRPLNCGQFFVELINDEFSFLLKGESGTGLYDDLPYFLLDLKPQGFLGRQIAKRIAEQSEDFPPDPKMWNTNHVGRYLISNGDDLPGNFILGEQTILRVQRKPIGVSKKLYPELAEIAVKGEPPGSSAGGEQPKFTAFNKDLGSHVIVKFSPKSDNEVAARWRDILITEYHAANVLSGHNYPAAAIKLFEMEGRLFLESQRFDRVGEFGRSSMLSLDMVDREFVGFGGGNWPRVMENLFSQKLIAEKDIQISKELQDFGRLINNTDMHLGNLSLSMEGDHFRLLPIYDMCSMGFAPKGGEVLPFDFDAFMKTDSDQAEMVKKMAYEFWESVKHDGRISEQFKAFLEQGNPIKGPGI